MPRRSSDSGPGRCAAAASLRCNHMHAGATTVTSPGHQRLLTPCSAGQRPALPLQQPPWLQPGPHPLTAPARGRPLMRRSQAASNSQHMQPDKCVTRGSLSQGLCLGRYAKPGPLPAAWQQTQRRQLPLTPPGSASLRPPCQPACKHRVRTQGAAARRQPCRAYDATSIGVGR